MEQGKIGRVFISPRVLRTIARLTALANPDVIRLAQPGLFRFHIPSGGVAIKVEDESVSVDLYIIANADANMYELGQSLQKEISRAIQSIVGMDVKQVNIHIEGVSKKKA